MHWDPWYKAGADVKTRCHNITGTKGDAAAGIQGDYLCPTPLVLLESAFEHMRSYTGKPADAVIWTGDDSPMPAGFPIPSPDLHMSQDRVFAIVDSLTKRITQTFGSEVPVFTSLGNHEVWAPSQLRGPDNKETKAIFETIGHMWAEAGWIPPAMQANFSAIGSYATRAFDGRLRVISVNTLWCDRGNVLEEVRLDGNGNDRMFAWLSDQLAEAEAASQLVWLIGHVPPTLPYSVDRCARRYLQLFRRYAGIIKSQFYGHTHKDHFTTYSLGDDNADDHAASRAMLFIVPSLTPESWHEVGQNPALRLYYYNRTTFEVVDYLQFFVDLPKANRQGHIGWELEYQASAAYNMTGNFGADAWFELSKRMSSDDALFDTVYNRFRSGHTPAACSCLCKREFVCNLQCFVPADYIKCML